MPREHPVERYYDRNTRRFLRFGGGSAAYAIHRQLWGPGVANVTAAAGYINHLLEDALRDLVRGDAPVIVDLGCGVGGTVLHLAASFPGATVHGVTISGEQAGVAERAANEAGISGRTRFHRADFESLDLGFEADALIAVESYTHSRSADAFFRVAARHLRPGGSLIVVDDFMTRDDADLAPTEQRLAQDFRSGWRVSGVCTTSACVERAQRHGFGVADERNLTELIRLDRPRDRLIGIIAPLAARLGLANQPFFGNLVGGSALHAGLKRRLFEYRWLRLEK